MPVRSDSFLCVATFMAASLFWSDYAATNTPVDSTPELLRSGTVNVEAITDLDRLLLRRPVIARSIGAASLSLRDDTWTTVGSMTRRRWLHTATLLLSGKVLVVGGDNGDEATPATAELYDPATRTWSPTGSLAQGRVEHTATLLGSGKVLVVGRAYPYEDVATTSEVYNPATGTWSPTGPMTPRYWHTATLLPSGRVLVAGGFVTSGASASAELYDPATNSWSPAASLPEKRILHAATLLPSGKVLLVGGQIQVQTPLGPGFRWVDTALRYDPGTNSWSSAGSLARVPSPSGPVAATRLLSGKVLVVGGGSSDSRAELYSEATGTWSPTGSLATPHESATVTLLPSGKVLVAGGSAASGPIGGVRLATAELYNPDTGIWESTGSLSDARSNHTGTLLRSGGVLATGGLGSERLSTAVSTAEVYDQASSSCALDVTSGVTITTSGFFPLFSSPFRLQLVAIRNDTSSPITGPLSFVLHDLQNAVLVSVPVTTSCFSAAADQFGVIGTGADAVLSPNESVLVGFWFYKTGVNAITYVPRVLSGVPEA